MGGAAKQATRMRPIPTIAGISRPINPVATARTSVADVRCRRKADRGWQYVAWMVLGSTVIPEEEEATLAAFATVPTKALVAMVPQRSEYAMAIAIVLAKRFMTVLMFDRTAEDLHDYCSGKNNHADRD